MPNLEYYDIILNPVVTERSMTLMSERKYCFYVHPKANKIQIKQAVEKMFEGVKVDSVNTMNIRGKNKRRGRVMIRTNMRKKAIVSLKEDSKEIEIFQGM